MKRFFPILLILALGIGSACTLVRVDMGPRAAPFVERTLAGEGPDKVLLISVSGVLMEGSAKPGPSPWSRGENLIARVTEELDRAKKDKAVKALLIRINSPGGTVSASDVLHHQISVFKKDKKVKVVAALMGVATSGGYYVAASADRIVALPTTVTGSVGVVSVKFDLSGLMGRYGVGTDVVKSGRLKDMWSPFRPAGSEERRVMQAMIDDMFKRFREVVKEGRPKITTAQLERISSAEIFTAAQALELGLIDRIAYPEEAFEEAKKMAGLDKARLIAYHRPGAHRPNIYAQGAENNQWAMNPTDWFSLAATPRLMYLWLPGAGSPEIMR